MKLKDKVEYICKEQITKNIKKIKFYDSNLK